MVSVPAQTETPVLIDHKVIDKSKYVLSQTEMPIYELITPEVNESYTEELARSLVDIPEVSAHEVEGVWVVNYLNKSFEIDRKDGSIWYADYDTLWNVGLGIEVPTPSSCRSTADAWLREKGMLPANAVFANIGSTNISAYNPDADELRSKVLQYHVNYEFTIDGYPVTGDTAQISVMIGNNGETVGFDWKWRDTKPEPYATLNLIEYESVLEAHGISPDDVTNHRLVYTADDGDDLLYPAWEIEFIEDATDDIPAIHNFVVIDGTLLKPQVEIITPSHGISVMPGTLITFDCTVSFGTPPFTYEWSSDFDGVLSTAKSFSTVSLSEVTKKGQPVPHAISVRVIDSYSPERRGTSDCIAVTIETVDFDTGTTLTLVAAGGAVILVASLLVLRRKKGGFVILFLLMMMSAFLFFPVSTAGIDRSSVNTYAPSAPTGAYDDGVKEVGIEWIGMSSDKPLWNTETNIEGFYNWMGSQGGYSKEFNWGEYSAWDIDFKDAQFNGIDTEWVDAVDFAYYQDHGGPDGVAFSSKHDTGGLWVGYMRLGDGDLDTIVFDACSPLAWENDKGENVFERWAPTLQGVHQICSFATTSQNSNTRGTLFGLYMTGFGIISPRTIMQAWFRACAETEGGDRQAALFYASKSPDPLNPQLDDPSNDYAYGFGYVCSDPTPGSFSWYVYVTSNC
jgi:hypothetical protein